MRKASAAVRLKALSVPRTPHLGWRLPWLQMTENKRQQARYQQQMVEIQAPNAMTGYARQMTVSQAIAQRPNPHLGSRT